MRSLGQPDVRQNLFPFDIKHLVEDAKLLVSVSQGNSEPPLYPEDARIQHLKLVFDDEPPSCFIQKSENVLL